MGLPDLMTAVLEYVEDVLVNDCGREAADRRLRYLGPAGLPQDCCTDNGTLSVSWGRGYGSPPNQFPTDGSTRVGACEARRPVYELDVHLDVCWPLVKDPTTGVTQYDGTWDERAADLAHAADCVARALIQLGCDTVAGELAAAVYAQLQGRDCQEGLRYRDVSSEVGGGCARITWRLFAGPVAPAVS